MTKGRTAIIVTHRLGSVKLAGRILVMKRGRLVEQGTHAELIESGGEYARLYAAQEQWYREGDNLFKTYSCQIKSGKIYSKTETQFQRRVRLA
jgi:ABC-type multidrug transport system ATPase subunit